MIWAWICRPGPVAELLLEREVHQASGRPLAEARARQPLPLVQLRRLRHLGGGRVRAARADRLGRQGAGRPRLPRLGSPARRRAAPSSAPRRPRRAGHRARQAGAAADDGPPAPALARGPRQGRGRGRPPPPPTGRPTNSEHGRYRRASRATGRDPRPEPGGLAARLGRADDDARGRRRGPRRDAGDPGAGSPRDVHRRRGRAPDRPALARGRRRRCARRIDRRRPGPRRRARLGEGAPRPSELRAELARASSVAENAWVEAKRRSDFSMLLPHLERERRAHPPLRRLLTTASPASATSTTRCSTSTSPR